MTLDTSVFDPMLKEYYSTEKKADLSYYDNILLGLFPKKQISGSEFVERATHAKPGNASATINTAITNQTASKHKAFHVTTVQQYAVASVTTKVILQSKDNMGAFEKAFEEFDYAHKSLAEKINRHMYRNTSGSIGHSTTATTVSTAVMTLDDKADVWNFEEGDVIALAANASETGGAVRSGTITVSSTDPEAGTVTYTGNITAGIAAAVNTDWCYHAGDYDLCAAGLESWLPSGSGRAAALAASFFGVTRSVNPERLGGYYLDATTSSYGDLNEVITTLVSRVVSRKGKPNVIVMHTDRFAQLQLLWLSKQMVFENLQVNVTERIDGRTVTFGTAYPGMKANVGGQIVTVIADRCCPTRKVYALQTNTWKVIYMGSGLPCFPREEMGQTSILVESSTADSYDGRVAGYYNAECAAPGLNGVALLPAI